MNAVFRAKWMPLLLLGVAYLLIYNPWVKFPYTFCVIILFILITTYLQDGHLEDLNFKRLGGTEIKTIVVCYVLLELSLDFIFGPLINWLCQEPADYSAFASIEGKPKKYLEWLLKMWVSAAIGEELLFRGYVFSELSRVIGQRKWILVVASAILFCLPHLYQGIAGLLTTLVFGLAFAFIYLKFQNIWVNIIVHGLIDTVFLTLSYLGLLEFYTLVW